MTGVAFSMDLLACVPSVLLNAAVGVPQSGQSVRRILHQFKRSQGDADPVPGPARPRTRGLLSDAVVDDLRNGIVPSWRYDRWLPARGMWAPVAEYLNNSNTILARTNHLVDLLMIKRFGSISLSKKVERPLIGRPSKALKTLVDEFMSHKPKLKFLSKPFLYAVYTDNMGNRFTVQ